MRSIILKTSILLILLSLMVSSIIVLDSYREISGNSEKLYQVNFVDVKILAPYGQSYWGPFRDGVIIVGNERIRVLITLYYSKSATEVLKGIKIWADAKGVPESGNVTFSPSSQNAIATRYDASGKKLEEVTGVRQPDLFYFELDEMAPGDRWEISYYIDVPPENQIPKLPFQIRLEIKIQFGAEYSPLTYYKVLKIIDRPIFRLLIVWVLALGTFAGILALGYLGFFRYYTTLDIVSMALIGAIMVVWVQILGRQLVFPTLNRIPMTHNFAVADFPYILLLVTAIALVRKPGAASLTLFVYNIVSEIGWYGLNILWWAYPFAQGLPVDLYLFLRGRGVLTGKPTFLRLRISEEELDKMPEISALKYIDGFMIGLLRGFFMQISLYLVFYPNLFRIEYLWEYVFWWHVIPWTIGNAIEGALSVPIVEKIEEAITY